MQLTDQALSAIMVALQKSLMEQIDIVPILRSYKFTCEGEELYVSNPLTSLVFTEEE